MANKLEIQRMALQDAWRQDALKPGRMAWFLLALSPAERALFIAVREGERARHARWWRRRMVAQPL